MQTNTEREEPMGESAFEALFVNNDDLHQLEAYLNRFNPIRVMGMQHQEIRHSAILAWLLNPQESHGFGDKILRAFLCAAFQGRREDGQPSALQIAQADLRDAVVRREWQDIDIFILLPRLSCAVIVENKFHARQHEGQLAKYAGRAREIYEGHDEIPHVRGIFLTLHDEDPADPSFAPIQYQALCEILPAILAREAQTVDADVATFVRHYIDIIQEASGMSKERTEMEKLARDLYRTHRKALDFIWEHGEETDFTFAVEAVFGEQSERGSVTEVEGFEVLFYWNSTDTVCFFPKAWSDAIGKENIHLEGCENYWSGHPLACWMQLFTNEDGGGTLRLYSEVGPIKDRKARTALIDKITAAKLPKTGFQRTATAPNKRYSKFLKGNIVEIKDAQDSEEIGRAMRTLLSRFAPVFDGVADVLPDFA
ncbi:PD-(D/E)XK nuclease family protein [Salipiger bermudensis]|uniref:PDDEXK-like family protein n=1 Tax=Salipiger bermudensis TaxID=344736 RepID=UPI001CD6BE0E|nr:PD-(D/E)XK nuclease family protein [Salipiger bermudensis]MCA0963207.1 PD-(D/E)XK nuclease family protein [Salipiger bermudensis]